MKKQINILLIVVLLFSSLPAFAEKIKVACIGNSITESTKLSKEEKYPSILQNLLGNDSYEVRNYGLSGCTLLKKGNKPYWNTDQYAEALAWKPDIVIIKLGTNDCHPDNRKYIDTDYKKDYIEMINSFKSANNAANVYACFPIPYFHEDSDRDQIITGKIIPLIKEISNDANVPVIDLHTSFEGLRTSTYDDTHPNANGTNIMANLICHVICPESKANTNPPAILIYEIFGSEKPYLKENGEPFLTQTAGNGYFERNASDVSIKNQSIKVTFGNLYMNYSGFYVEIPEESRSSKGYTILGSGSFIETPVFNDITKLTMVTTPKKGVATKLLIQKKGLTGADWVTVQTLNVTASSRTNTLNIATQPAALRIVRPESEAGDIYLHDFIMEGHLYDEKGIPSAINIPQPDIRKKISSTEYYDFMGKCVNKDNKGLIIKHTKFDDGSTSSNKILNQ